MNEYVKSAKTIYSNLRNSSYVQAFVVYAAVFVLIVFFLASVTDQSTTGEPTGIPFRERLVDSFGIVSFIAILYLFHTKAKERTREDGELQKYE